MSAEFASSSSSIQARLQPAAADSGRAMARAVLDAALSGIDLTPGERRFLARLSHWDKRNATIVASLLSRAREAGRQETLAHLEAALDYQPEAAVAS